MAPSVELQIHDAAYSFALPDGTQQVTALNLKAIFKASHKLLYHEKLRFHVQGQQLEDNETVPLSPALVRVGGPTAVVNMLELALRSCRSSQQAPRAPSQAEPLKPAPQGCQLKPAAGQPQKQPLPQQLRPVPAQGQQPRLLPHAPLLQQQRQPSVQPFPLPYGEARQTVSSATSFGSAVPSSAGTASARAPQSAGPYWTAPATSPVSSIQGFEPWGGGGNFNPRQPLAAAPGLLDYQQQQEAALAEEMELQRALKASQMLAMADEEEQLRWALDESARLAEAERRAAEEAQASRRPIEEQTPEEIRAYYEEAAKKKVPSDKSQSTAEPRAAGAHQWESDDEGSAWDSVGEDAAAAKGGPACGSDEEEDEELPPLELIPNSEE